MERMHILTNYTIGMQPQASTGYLWDYSYHKNDTKYRLFLHYNEEIGRWCIEQASYYPVSNWFYLTTIASFRA